MNKLHITAADIAAHYAILDDIGNLGPGRGFLRAPYSDAESQAMAYFEGIATNSGLRSRYDSIGNLIIETPGHFEQWIETGSHLDTVPEGGNFDGCAGVVAGFTAIALIWKQTTPLRKGLRLRIFRGEESACFGIASIGSRAAFGVLPASALQQCWQGKSLATAMQEQHANPSAIESGKAALTERECNRIDAFIELHIEQGKVLQQQHLEIGIVTSIRGSKRNWVTLKGVFDHSGATPMGAHYRHDCNLAMAYMQVRLDDLLRNFAGQAEDLVQTVGIINSHDGMNQRHNISNNAVSKISGAACFSFEVRGANISMVDQYCRQAFTLIEQTAREFGISAAIETFSDQAGVATLDHAIRQQLADGCAMLNFSHREMASGAWHDAGTCAQHQRNDGSTIPTGMIFIPCRDGISHSPDEHATTRQIANGASLLAICMQQLAT
ncbi:MAG: hydantoinase/carbamoylase family amidase [Mariprofundus sp.]